MDRVGDAFVWPFRDPEWLEKVVIIGLISLIPIVGGINGAGWMMAAIRRLRAGEERLPPGSFDYLWPGFQLFVALLVYYLVVLVVAGVFFAPALLLITSQANPHGNTWFAVVGFALLLMAFGLALIGSLAVYFIVPAITLGVLDGGIAGGLAINAILRRSTRHPINTLLAGLMLLAAGFIGGLGIYVAYVGLVLTYPYSLAMQAWIIHSFELGATAPNKSQEAMRV
jgi:uncharacterized protein DUF4013